MSLEWVPLETRPLKTGYYLVGHAGHQEKLLFSGPEREWLPGAIMGWQRQTSQGWVRDDPAERFNATHCAFIDPPPKPMTGFDYFECPLCGFDSVQRSTFDGSYYCPLCAGDSGHDVAMTRRPATAEDGKVEGFDARKGTRAEQMARRGS